MEIFGFDYSKNSEYLALVDFLAAFKIKEGTHWDNYRQDIPYGILDKWRKMQIECYRNGYVLCGVSNGVIKWFQITSSRGKTNDKCTLCERKCERRELINSGKAKYFKWLNKEYEEPKPCWMKGGLSSF